MNEEEKNNLISMQHAHNDDDNDNAIRSGTGSGVIIGKDLDLTRRTLPLVHFPDDYAIDNEDDVDVISTESDYDEVEEDAKQFTGQKDNLRASKYTTRLSVAHPHDRNDFDSSLSFKEFRRSLSILKRSMGGNEVDVDAISEEDDDYGSVDSEGTPALGDNSDEKGGGERPTSVPSYLQIVNHQAEEDDDDDDDHPSSYALQTSVRARKSITWKSMISVTGGCDRRSKLNWLKSFYHLDPRWQICNFFGDLAYEGVGGIDETGRIQRSGLNLPSIMRAFTRVGVFSVWRPTSNESIRRMMTGLIQAKELKIELSKD